jgi:hypothetical protein
MPDAATIRQSIKQRLTELEPLLAEFEALKRADALLSEVAEAHPITAAPAPQDDEHAPYGYKADGTPRKRPALSAEGQAKAKATRERKRKEREDAARPKRVEVRLAGLASSLHPTEQELADREVAWTTEEPK